ncbi:glycosyl hydrolase family 3 N terminal domain-containing protein [Colletotrichum navitas]|uniref:beta-glucosidase n=1 Tax=Colletotrichum navitas TaxID=681940 RepID=A0AAD8PT71_9PEZI|nr:glycosyl hydrolase family 3 N terminal domain-containing protein [Colletotrichum navitas]KAK1579792.1 glycosyl hydrolase family 3 N terminal domain-containing protein [Colletotrichum navitas]
MKLSLAFASSLLVTAVAAQNATYTNGTATPVYKNPNATIDDRVSDLLKRMTIEEKTAQLIQGDITNYLNLTDGTFNQSGLTWLAEKRSNSIWTGLYTNLTTLAYGARVAQDYLVHNTTLGIPAFIQSEGIHGFLALNATIFNSPIAHGCSWNPQLVEKMARVIAIESKALGVNQLFAPNVDLARELRFGRVEECYGEDPFLVGEYGYSYTKGLQGEGVCAMIKHFAAFATPEQGVNTAPVHGGPRELHTTYLPPFKRAIIDADAWSVMSSYNSYDGVPTVTDHHLLTEILREEWGYEHYVISDAGGTARVSSAFLICGETDDSCITLSTLPAGNDAEMGGGRYSFQYVPELVANGTLPENIVDTAVSRVLRAKFKSGLFEHPYTGVPNDKFFDYVNTEEHRKVARDLDAESIVLLENHNETLPLKKDAHVAVIGPMAHGYHTDYNRTLTRLQYGDYVIHTAMERGVTPLDGIRAASEGTVTYAKGGERWSNDQSGFPEAIAAAEAADVAVVVVGTWSRDQNELWAGLNATTGEHIDVHDFKLVGAMSHLVKAIIDTGKPTVVVFSSGKPVTEPWISDEAGALVQMFYQGEEGGHALADILYGNVNPSGKLSVAFPHDVGTTPVYYNYLNSARASPNPGREYLNGTLVFGSDYVLSNPLPLYEFGYGLSYSNFKYADISVSSSTVSPTDTVTLNVKVTNNSTRDGAEVVQVYIKDMLSSVAVPNKQLRGFSKVFIKAGETANVSIDLPVSGWGLWDRKLQYVVEPGDFTVLVGSSSDNIRGNATVTVV